MIWEKLFCSLFPNPLVWYVYGHDLQAVVKMDKKIFTKIIKIEPHIYQKLN